MTEPAVSAPLFLTSEVLIYLCLVFINRYVKDLEVITIVSEMILVACSIMRITN